MVEVPEKMTKQKQMMKTTPKEFSETGVFALELHLLDHIVEYGQGFGILYILSSSTSVCYNVNCKKEY